MILHNRTPEWKRIYAICPVPINEHGDRAWLEWVERRAIHSGGLIEMDYQHWWQYEYRLIGSTESARYLHLWSD